MATKKKSKLSAKQRSLRNRRVQQFSMAVLLAVILVVAYLVILGNRNTAEANLTAPRGTTARALQIDSSELDQEKALDSSFDNERHATAQSDAAALGDVGQVVQDAN